MKQPINLNTIGLTRSASAHFHIVVGFESRASTAVNQVYDINKYGKGIASAKKRRERYIISPFNHSEDR